MKGRANTRFYANCNTIIPINNYNKTKNKLYIESCRINDKLYWPFGSRQTEIDKRQSQMNLGISIELHLIKGENKSPKYTSTGKFFKIISIKRGYIPGIPKKFNGYIAKLQRVQYYK